MAKTSVNLADRLELRGDRYEVELEVPNDYNVHIAGAGSVGLDHLTAGVIYSDTYQWNQDVIDEDVVGRVWPKKIRISCSKIPTEIFVSYVV